MSRSVLVTGADRGIGLAIAEAFAAAGDRVMITYRTGTQPPSLAAVRCDVRDPEAVERAYAEVEATQGDVEVLVANAGMTRDGMAAGQRDEDFEDVVATNLGGAARVARRAARGMIGARWGRLLFVSSALALTGAPGQSNYCAAKAGLIGLARSMAWELGSRNITANVVAPGFVETGMTSGVSDRRREDLRRMTPLGRWGTAAEVAAAVRFLASDDAAYVTSAVVPVSGGLGMGL